MKNFPFEYEGKTYWWSRSVAVATVLFAKDVDGNWYVLANKRGEGCPDFKGYWNCPCGYLDCNETTDNAAIREIYEETGINIKANDLKFDSISSDPTDNKQNVSARYYTILPHTVDWYFSQISADNSEANEIADISFIKISDIYKHKWAFKHQLIITDFYNKYIICPWWKKLIRKMYEFFCN